MRNLVEQMGSGKDHFFDDFTNPSRKVTKTTAEQLLGNQKPGEPQTWTGVSVAIVDETCRNPEKEREIAIAQLGI